MSNPAQTASVVICAYTEDRWPDLVAAVQSVLDQTAPAHEVIVVIDHNPALLERATGGLPGATVIPNDGSRGLSGARNSGIIASTGEVVAFLDDDAIASPDWLEHLIVPFDREEVFAVGGTIFAAWESEAPRWFPEEFLWVVGCTYRGQPTSTTPVRNVIGANMAFRRRVFDEVGLFRDDIGRVGTEPVGCEETEICIRAGQRWPDQMAIFEPRATVRHRVPAQRGSVRYFRARCFAEGRSKAQVAAYVGQADGLATERDYTLRTLPKGALRGATDLFRGDAAGVGRSVAIVAGLGMTTIGYCMGRLGSPRRTETRSQEPNPELAHVAAR